MRPALLILALILLILVRPGFAADWPTYRADAARSGYTDEALPAGLALRWKREARHAPQPAWTSRDTRMPFDRGPRLAVAGGTVFFGSSADGKLHALDAGTGNERWSFFTEGPVRLGPTVWKDRVFVPGDDGFVYCVSAADGKLLWKYRCGPDRSWVLGNGRMMSRWPVRGAPVVEGGTLYLAAGIWPSEEVSIHALDPETGAVRWLNECAGSIVMPQPHPTAVARSGVAAQGDLTVSGDRLLLPTGRGVPAAFDRKDGRMLYFHLQRYGRQGGSGSGIVAFDGQFSAGGSLFNLETGDLEGQDLGTAALVTPAQLIVAQADGIVAIDRRGLWTEKESMDKKGGKTVKRALSSPLWKLSLPHRADVLIAAGPILVAGTEGRVSLLDTRSKETIFGAEVDGAPHDLAVSDGRLFASTDRGTIYCFAGPAPAGGAADSAPGRLVADAPEGVTRGGPGEPPDGAADGAPDEAPAPLFEEAAREILQRSGLCGGYCADIACGDGSLALALARISDFRIYAVDSDPESVARARRRLDRAGLHGIRVTVHQADPADTAYPDYFANLVVSGRSALEGAGVVPMDEARRIQRPYGGVTCLGRPGAMDVTVRGKLEGAGSWTHQYGDPGNTGCSGDEILEGPLGILWFTDLGFDMPSRHGRGPAPLFQDGRLFIEGTSGILCTDAYNGSKIWEIPLAGVLEAYDQEHLMGSAGTGSNMCISGTELYVHTGDRCLKLDAASGTRLLEIPAPPWPDGKPGTWGAIACDGGRLFGTIANSEHIVKWRWQKGDMRKLFTESSCLFALDPATGSATWVFRPEHSIRHNAVAIGGGKVYLIDRPLAPADRIDFEPAPGPDKKATADATHLKGRLLSLDAERGTVLWENRDDIYGTLLALSTANDVLLMAYQYTSFRLDSERGRRMAAFRASDGARLWDVRAEYATRPIINGRTVYAQPGAWDLLTGKRKDFLLERSYGCGIPTASRNLIVYRSATLGYVDLLSGRGTVNFGGIRPGCWINAIPAGGLVLMPDATHGCTCSYLNKASIALLPHGVRAPRIEPDGAISSAPVTVRLAADRKDSEVRYTLDGSSPTRDSLLYSAPLEMARSGTLKARAFRKGSPPSPVAWAAFTVDPSLVPLAGPDWKVHDAPGAKPRQSRWQARADEVAEASNIFLGDAKDADPSTERPGTFREYAGGGSLGDGELQLQLASTDDDGLGVAVGFQGPDRYCLWAMDSQRGFHVLALKDGAGYRALATRKEGYQQGRWYQLRLRIEGRKITALLDGAQDLEAVLDAPVRGTFALYSWGSSGAKFRAVRWIPETGTPGKATPEKR